MKHYFTYHQDKAITEHHQLQMCEFTDKYLKAKLIEFPH